MSARPRRWPLVLAVLGVAAITVAAVLVATRSGTVGTPADQSHPEAVSTPF